jgi:phytoene/squalene synthetase
MSSVEHLDTPISQHQVRPLPPTQSTMRATPSACGFAPLEANILHDIVEDARRHRLYLPRGLLHAQGIFATTPRWAADPEPGRK